MKTYRLQALLDLRIHTHHLARLAFAVATKTLAEQQQQLECEKKKRTEMEQTRDTLRWDYADQLASGDMSMCEYLRTLQYTKHLRSKEQGQQSIIETHQYKLEKTTQEVRVRKAQLLAAMQSQKALEQHAELWAGQMRQQRLRREEGVLNEISQVVSRRNTNR
ncbi:MAG: hypothetical protein KTR25_15225 [Myxococcales bacterium]|nr:hypothetical protein [Myxococcales bacterium]